MLNSFETHKIERAVIPGGTILFCKISWKLGCVIYTGAHYTQINTVYHVGTE